MLGTGVWMLSAGQVSIPYSSGEKCKVSEFRFVMFRRITRTVSIPYSSGEKCKKKKL